ncbi:hypothetical protein [Laspinema sp. D2d]|nr:hypothetical protein [Laspinema sp. D2d]
MPEPRPKRDRPGFTSKYGTPRSQSSLEPGTKAMLFHLFLVKMQL